MSAAAAAELGFRLPDLERGSDFLALSFAFRMCTCEGLGGRLSDFLHVFAPISCYLVYAACGVVSIRVRLRRLGDDMITEDLCMHSIVACLACAADLLKVFCASDPVGGCLIHC